MLRLTISFFLTAVLVSTVAWRQEDKTGTQTEMAVVGSYYWCSDYGTRDSLVIYQNHKMKNFIGQQGEDFKISDSGTWSMKSKTLIVTRSHFYEDGKQISLPKSLVPSINQYKVINDKGKIMLELGHVYFHKYK